MEKTKLGAPIEAPKTSSKLYKVRLTLKISKQQVLIYRVNAMDEEHAKEVALRRFKASYPRTWKFQEAKVVWVKEV